MAKRYARTVGELKKMLNKYKDSDEIYVEHVRQGEVTPVGLEILHGYLLLYPPTSYELSKEGDDVSNTGRQSRTG